eukprot:1216884-Lingulodinium_polyedra.AAC.1
MQLSRYAGCRGVPPSGSRRHSGGTALCGLNQGLCAKVGQRVGGFGDRGLSGWMKNAYGHWPGLWQ